MNKLILFLTLLLFNSWCFTQSRYVSESTKKIVYTRDGGICQCCGSSTNLEYDHIIPYSCGGSSDPSNIQLLCLPCNRSKSNSCTCKIHRRRVGTNCCENEPSKKPTSSATQCTGTTKKGARCKNRTTNSNSRCHLH
jgi:5-methylcytosine-specific restriction endonuclease McrA